MSETFDDATPALSVHVRDVYHLRSKQDRLCTVLSRPCKETIQYVERTMSSLSRSSEMHRQ